MEAFGRLGARLGLEKILGRIPRPLLDYVLAPLVLTMLPLVLWLSVPPAGASGATLVWLAVPDPIVFGIDPLYLFSLVLIGFLAILMLAVEASLAAFSLHLMHWIFVYIFFFAAPLVQYRIGVFPWNALTSLETGTLLVANLAILLWCVTWIASRLTQLVVFARRPVPLGPRVSRLGVWLTLALAVLATLYLIATLGPGLLTRASNSANLGDTSSVSSASLALDKLLRGFPVAATAGTLWFMRAGRASLAVRLGLVAASMGLLLVADFPLGSARYLIGAVYLGLLLTVLGRYLRTGWPVVFLLVGGLLVLFPFLSTLRFITSPREILSYLGSFNFLGPSLATGDFDAYSMVGYTAEYVHDGPGVTFGRQLLGVIFFFVPRSLWPGKPVGSGYTVAVDGGLAFNNVSSSPLAEGLINFGWVGVALFAFVLCWLFGTLDASYERAQRKGYETLLGLIYPFWIGFAFFLMRGDLLSSTAFIVGFSVAFLPLLARLPEAKLRLRTKRT